ncbi:UDP-N-acetylmuramoyl-tripeptide--D-alanyl-D-alanine ligase [Paraconexibacter sp.]|uniref:UDP-N-acetylmuramoyl-tripeptide--D-alanyl-D- alanine ligase n=1 Tax=Paraconexibacter sp. TaxID=2949640 RepID=UPI00356175C9
MHDRTPDWIAAAAGARLLRAVDPTREGSAAAGPRRAVIDSRVVLPGDLFVGLPGTQVDGGRFAAQTLAAGAWGALVHPDHADAAQEAAAGVVLAADDPLLALQQLATAWRRQLAAVVIGITGSTGKTSTKDLVAAMLRAGGRDRLIATSQNFNTEIGLPLTVLGAPPGTDTLVLEKGMRGPGQIAQLTRISEPDVAIITNVGPVHLELLGSVAAVAAAKAELLTSLRPGGTAVIPADEPLLEQYLRDDLQIVRFGPGGDIEDLPGVRLLSEGIELTSAHMRRNALAAAAAVRAAGIEPRGDIEVALSARRGQRERLAGGVIVVDDCYNANPMSMRAALDDLAATAPARRVAVLGDMLELGPDEKRFHSEIGVHARDRGVDVLVVVGERAAYLGAGSNLGNVHAVPDAATAARLVPTLVQDGDTVLIKASRGIGLEVVAEALRAARPGEDVA